MLALIDKNGTKKFIIEDNGNVKVIAEDITKEDKKDEEGSSK